jgi:moderate conductance mechanosensitive channel
MASLDFFTDTPIQPAAEALERILPQVPSALVSLLLGILFIRFLAWISRLIISLVRLPKGLKGILTSMIEVLLWVFLIIVFLSKLGLGNVALAFSGSLAALGFALAAGGATLAGDILAGIFLARDKDFNVGDEVIAGEKPTQGVIESMDMRRTRLLATDGKLHIIPNSVIERKEWVLVTRKKDRVAQALNADSKSQASK